MSVTTPDTTSLYQTPDQFLAAMLQNLQSNATKVTDFTAGSVARTVLGAVSLVNSQQSLTADQLRSDSLISKATGSALDVKAGDYFLVRKAAVQATGTIRLTRAAAQPAITIPSGWSQLSTKPAPGQQPVTFVTTADGVWGSGLTTLDIPAIAVAGGANGNINATTVLVPANPVNGVVSDGGIVVQVAFTGGADAESDDDFRNRIRINVQGRVNGSKQAYLAAALNIGGVLSANVLKAGDTRSNSTVVAAGLLEVYYNGSSGLLAAVQSACNNVAVVNAGVTAFQAASSRLVVGCTVTAYSGTDTSNLTTAIVTALQALVNTVAVGGKVYYSQGVRAILAVAGVIAVNVPLSDFRKFTDAPGTAADIQAPVDQYPSLAAADITVAINLITPP